MKDKFTESFDELRDRLEGKSLKAVMTAVYDEFDGLSETNVRDLVVATSSVKDLFEAQLAEAKKAWEDELAASGDDDDDVDEEELRKKIEEELRKSYEQKWEAEQKKLEQSYKKKLKEELKKADTKPAVDVEELKRQHSAEIEELKRQHSAEIEGLKRQHAADVENLKKASAPAPASVSEEPDSDDEVWIDYDGKKYAVKGCIQAGDGKFYPITKTELETLQKFDKVKEDEKRVFLPLSKNPDGEVLGSYSSYLKSISK